MANGKIFISGGGRSFETYVIDKRFVKELKNRKILYIPIGLKRTFIGYEECYDWIKETMQQFSLAEIYIEMWVNLKNLNYSHIKKFDAIYIGGASNTYDLLYLLRRYKTNEKIRDFVMSGGIIYGGSSGGIVLGNDVKTSKDEKCGNLTSEGLNLVSGYSVWCHSNISTSLEISTYVRISQNPVIAIPENSGLLYYKNKFTVLGLSTIKIFGINGINQELKPGESININD